MLAPCYRLARRVRKRLTGGACGAAGALVLLGPAGAGALFLALHHLDDQLDHLLDPGRLGLTLGERLAPVPDLARVASSLKAARWTSRRTLASEAMSLVTFGPGSSTR